MRPEDKYWSHSQEEVEEVLRVVYRTKHETILEIGCFKFAMISTFLLSAVQEPNPLVIGIDPRDHDPDKRILLSNCFGKKFQFIHASSQSDDAKIQLSNILKDRKIDILYIDGAHQIAAVISDTKDYLKFMDSKGYIIWHDALQNNTVFRYHFYRLGERYPISLHFIKDSLIAYIEVSKFIEAEERMKRWNKDNYDKGKWKKWPPNTPNVFWSSIAA